MFSLQRVLSKDDPFFTLLEASAEQAHQSVQQLIELLKNPTTDRSLDEFILTRRKEKKISEDISAALCATFITPLEREDIEALSRALYKIPKTVEKFGEQLVLCQPKLKGGNFGKQTRLLVQTTDAVLQMVKALKQKPRLEVIKEHNERLQYLEGEADKVMLALLQDLYSGQYEPLQVLMLRNLYELLEKVIDRCRDAGNIVFHIVLKQS